MIEVRDVRKNFGTQQVLRGASLRIEKGEAVVIIGRSGGGKSILLKHLIGLLRPDSGSVLVDGKDLACMDERELLGVRRQFGMLFQMAALFDSLDVFDNVSFVLRRERKHTEAEIRALVADALDRVELPGIEKKKPAELSGGMRKRVGLARAIVYRPRIVLYDEPTTGLQFHDVKKLLEVLHELVDQGNSVVVIEHNLEVIKTADWVIDMGPEGGDGGGAIVAQGTPEKIAADPKSHTGRFLKEVLARRPLARPDKGRAAAE
jgi:phospholipid/cholesterol/gamma-HCH transport system ATP-binding protein